MQRWLPRELEDGHSARGCKLLQGCLQSGLVQKDICLREPGPGVNGGRVAVTHARASSGA